MAIMKKQLLDFADPGPLDESLTQVPGFLGEVTDWATRFVTHVSASMLHEAQFHVSEGKFDRLVKRVIGILAKAGGTMERTPLLRSLHIDSATFQRVTRTLHMSDMIEEEWLDRRKVVFTLKNT